MCSALARGLVSFIDRRWVAVAGDEKGSCPGSRARRNYGAGVGLRLSEMRRDRHSRQLQSASSI